MTIEFQAWPKTPRLFRDMIITEKIDGTNAAIHVKRLTGGFEFHGQLEGDLGYVMVDGVEYLVAAQSRKRLITPTEDNHGFARWVHENAAELVTVLGEGVHYGEWWGSGIQRGYGLEKGDKRFSLFNVNRYAHLSPDSQDYEPHDVRGLGLVPILWEGAFDTVMVSAVLGALERRGSLAAPGFMRPEGVIVFHAALNGVFKATIENDEPR